MNMNTIARLSLALLGTAALLGPLAAIAADAPKSGATCMDITYDAEFLASYPRAAAACQEVVENGGKRAARFTAKVTRAKKDHVQLQFMNSMGKPIEPAQTLTLLPQAGQTMRVNGKDVPFSKLAKGDMVDFWIPEKTLGVITNPATTAATTIVLP